MILALFKEFKSTIKSPDTEEKIDLLLYRPLGFCFAKCAQYIGLTPSGLSLIGLMSGLVAAFYYLNFNNTKSLFIGSFYFILSGIFDSSDGQLARLTQQSTKLGLILDGICDSLVTIAIYLTCSYPYVQKTGVWFWGVVIIALHLHSCQCAILDFYHREYLYFGYGKVEGETYWNPSIADAQKIIRESSSFKEKIFNQLRMTWIRKQQWLTSRSDSERIKMRYKLFILKNHEREEFMMEYRKHNLWLLPYWRLVGVNAHTALIIIFMFQKRFDVYMIGFDLIILNAIIFIIGGLQRNSDKRFLRKVKIN